MSIDISGVIFELRQQGWELTLRGDGSEWKAVPPKKSGRIVHFNARPASPVPVIRELRHEGFVWPPKATGHDEGEVEPQVRSTPFPPKPNPDTSTEPQPGQARHSEQELKDATALAFLQLQEAKEYERLAAAELIKCNAELEAVKRTAANVSSAYAEALRSLKEAKQTFDHLFDTDLPTGA